MAVNNKPHIEFIMPSKPVLVSGFLLRNRKKIINIYKNTIPILAALTPKNFHVTATDESVERISIKKNVDIIGISLNTAFANRGYEIADSYRKIYKKIGKELTIVFGGSHATALPEEALEHGDVVVMGEAERSWPLLLSDYLSGQLQKTYPKTLDDKFTDPDLIPIPKRDLLTSKSLISINALQLSRGCPKACEFCSIGSGTRVRRIPLDRVEAEIAQMKGSYIALLDDNFFGNLKQDQDYVFKVLKLFRKYSKKWVTQMPLYAGDDYYLVEEMIGSGCKAVYIGIDSIDDTFSGKLNKNRVVDPIKTLLRMKKMGLYVMAGFVFGFDSESIGVFSNTIKFAESAKLNLASFHILTPYPGTKLYDRFKKENRITHDKEWHLFDTAHVVFRPQNMSEAQLYNGFCWSIREFYSLKSIISRNYKRDPFHVLANIMYWLGVHQNRFQLSSRPG